jgi:uncharacterized protein (TIGR02757 family)
MTDVKTLLDAEAKKRDSYCELSLEKPDPLYVAREQDDDRAILLCALFAYGNARLIVKLLSSFDFELLNGSEKEIEDYYKEHYYRFQSKEDVAEIFKAFSRIEADELKSAMLEGYKKEHDMLDAINAMIGLLYKKTAFRSNGCSFLYGRLCHKSKRKGASPYKRWNMFLRWMVRKDCLDLGRWSEVDRAHLLMPLDTHTFTISQKLGLLNRKTYDLESVYLLTQKLKEFDKNDPLKYDFALYRIGQEGLI